jgi:hypothetical protein
MWRHKKYIEFFYPLVSCSIFYRFIENYIQIIFLEKKIYLLLHCIKQICFDFIIIKYVQ